MKFEAIKDKKRNIILSTDIAADCDDVGAIALLHSYADEYGFDILGMCNCTTRREGTNTIYAINKFLGKADIMLGEYALHTLPEIAERSKYIDEISKRFGEGAPMPMESTAFYRRLLAQAEDDSVVIITIGFFTDLALLLKSEPDEYSDLDGIELVRRKVSHVVSMAAKYPRGTEFNIRLAPAEAKFVFDNLPCNIYLSDFYLGRGMMVGFDYKDAERLKDNPIYETYRLFTTAYSYKECKNNAYDLTAVQFAVLGEGELYRIGEPGKLRFYTEIVEGTEALIENNATEFIPDESGNVFFLEAVDKDAIRDNLNRRISQ